MKKALPIGVDDYRRLKENNYYAVDKTLMIEEFLQRQSIVTLITRPRRFGKTLNMSMMAEFFDITKDSKEIFNDTNIIKSLYASNMNQYPTIFVSFANAKGDQINVVQQIKEQLRNEYNRYEHIFNNLSKFEEDDYKQVIDGLMSKSDGKLNNIIDALSFLMKILEKYYQRKVMLFIDEYDTPFIEAHVNGFYVKIKNGLASLLHNSLKTSNSLQYALLTGIQRVAKENIFSDLNNLVVCTVKDHTYDKYFGFNEQEAKELLEYYDLKLNDDVKQMYDGYHIGNQEIYNPWSIINYADTHELQPYWVNTSSNKMIKKAMIKKDQAFNQGYEKLVAKGYLQTLVHLETSFFESRTTSSLWGLFVNAGYLTIAKTISLRDRIYIIKIPNQEVQEEFMNLTAYYLDVSDTLLADLFYALKITNQNLFTTTYQRIIKSLPSYYDLKDENSYHMMMLGMCAWLSNEYEIISNKEIGKGRCDIILKAKGDFTSYIFEFKYTKNNHDNLDVLANKAIKQIEKRNYNLNLKGKVIYVGLAHLQKEVVIKWKELEND
ncbi:MAG: AAA family ATPase [[Clostridium] spiroforme]|uniref:AAA family ATPase n=1 Tax=Thomasclavelia spiroformis TaxID=29348 RepID=A0A943I5K3_9FIRM|nr:AAA family ATPase [Thomasclavelia spiroformis]MBS5587575.1 AAA family ATPase [Thomasclavelia spiroformis]